jgi:MinD-like ATPase involved in chromosome partitioning or flagellar assembly
LSDQEAGFRAQQRFTDPAESVPAESVPAESVPAEGTTPTPRNGLPRSHSSRPAVPQHDDPPPYLDLSTVALLGQPKRAPSQGWRKWLYLASFKLINVGESPKVIHLNSLVAQVQRPLRGCYRIALLSLKGGVGKTTVTATLGATFASIRGDRVVAVDANPDRGTLSQKVPLETSATVRHLLRDAEGIEAYSDVRGYTSQGPSRLEVLASESDPAVSEAFSSDDYTRTLEVLERFYSLVLTDCGTGMLHSAMSAVLDKADVLIVISSGSVDGARSASATLDWLDAHGHQEMVRNSIAVINAVRPGSGKVDLKKVVDHFSRRCRAVKQVPFDPHLEEGAEISLDRLKPETREALVELAAVVAADFSGAKQPDAPSG